MNLERDVQRMIYQVRRERERERATYASSEMGGFSTEEILWEWTRSMVRHDLKSSPVITEMMLKNS